MRFQARLFSTDAGVVIRNIDAANEVEAFEQAQAQARLDGASLLSLDKVANPHVAAGGFDVPGWCRELGTLLAAGMTVVEALETVRSQASEGRAVESHEQLLARLNRGQSLSDAMQAIGVFPPMLLAGVRAGERTGGLVAALQDYLRYHELVDSLRRKSISAAIYPTMVLILGGAISLFLLIFVVPRFASMFEGREQGAGWATRMLFRTGDLLGQQPVVAGAVALIVAALLLLAVRSGMLLRLFARVIEHLSPVRRVVDHFRFAKLYRSLALMIRGGYSVDEAMHQCAALGLGPRVDAGVAMAMRAIQSGKGVSSAFASAGLTDGTAARLLAVGERSGNFDQVLQAIADRHARHFETAIERATRVVEPALLLVMALVVGTLVLLMYMPVFDIAGGIR